MSTSLGPAESLLPPLAKLASFSRGSAFCRNYQHSFLTLSIVAPGVLGATDFGRCLLGIFVDLIGLVILEVTAFVNRGSTPYESETSTLNKRKILINRSALANWGFNSNSA